MITINILLNALIVNNGIVYKCKYCKSLMKKDGYNWKCTNPNCNSEELSAKEWQQKQENEENIRHSKAIHYTIDDVPKESSEWFYSDKYSDNEGFFDDIDKFIDCCKDNDTEIPDYVWRTKRVPFTD